MGFAPIRSVLDEPSRSLYFAGIWTNWTRVPKLKKALRRRTWRCSYSAHYGIVSCCGAGAKKG